ncbi:MAG: hypothetical protein U5K56_19935 [Halioglobus sp.]|nr:hypothetical protein [Halioglobus sp.]
MDISIVILSVLISAGTAAAGYIIWLQARQAADNAAAKVAATGGVSRRRPGAAVAPQPFPDRATSIRCEARACEAVKTLARRRFLVSEGGIPRLPLADCDTPGCGCVYVKHNDRRRHGDDRREIGGMSQLRREHAGEPDRRSGRERRGADLVL